MLIAEVEQFFDVLARPVAATFGQRGRVAADVVDAVAFEVLQPLGCRRAAPLRADMHLNRPGIIGGRGFRVVRLGRGFAASG